jgi:hypothetical protein
MARIAAKRYYNKRGKPVPAYLTRNRNVNESNASFTRNLNRFTKVSLLRRKLGGVKKSFSRPIISLLNTIKGRINILSENARDFYTFILQSCDELEESILKNTRIWEIIKRVSKLGLRTGPMAVAGGILIWMLLPLPIKAAMVVAYIFLRIRDARKKRGNEKGLVRRALDGASDFARDVMIRLNDAPKHVLNAAVAAAAALGSGGLNYLKAAGLAENPVALFKEELEDERRIHAQPIAMGYDPSIRGENPIDPLAEAREAMLENMGAGSGLSFNLTPRS